MSLTQHIITPQQLAGVGVVGMADVPGLSAAEMQEKLEETARKVIIPHFNAAMQEAGETLAKMPETTLVQQMINDQVLATGAGDMTKLEYAGSTPGTVARADAATVAQSAEKATDSEKLGGQLPDYYATAEAVKKVKETADNALPKDGKAANSYMLNGQGSDYYATAIAAANAQNTANTANTTANAAIPKNKLSFSLSGTTLTITKSY